MPSFALYDKANGLGLDGDAALALDIHLIEELRALLALGERAGSLQDPIGQRRFAVIDVGDDRKIPDQIGSHEGDGGTALRLFLTGRLQRHLSRQHVVVVL